MSALPPGARPKRGTEPLPPDDRRGLWIAAALIAGWAFLILILVNVMTQVLHSILWQSSDVILTPYLRNCLLSWISLSVASHLIWFFAWGDEDYHRLAIHCAYLGRKKGDPDLDVLALNAGSLPGYLLGITLTA